MSSFMFLLCKYTPVFKISGFFMIQFGRTSPINIEKPKIKMLREEFISACCNKISKVNFLSFCQVKCHITQVKYFSTCKFETPTADMIPNMTKNIPPMIGVGIVLKMAPIFPNNPIMAMMTPLATITMRLPTCKINVYSVVFFFYMTQMLWCILNNGVV